MLRRAAVVKDNRVCKFKKKETGFPPTAKAVGFQPEALETAKSV
jgi:hypothetical protein